MNGPPKWELSKQMSLWGANFKAPLKSKQMSCHESLSSIAGGDGGWWWLVINYLSLMSSQIIIIIEGEHFK